MTPVFLSIKQKASSVIAIFAIHGQRVIIGMDFLLNVDFPVYWKFGSETLYKKVSNQNKELTSRLDGFSK